MRTSDWALMALFLVCAIPLVGCAEKANMFNGSHYFAGISGKEVPFLPVEPITESEARSLRSYVAVTYDDEGRISLMTKYLDGKEYFVQSFHYVDMTVKVKFESRAADVRIEKVIEGPSPF